jgi:ribokinase
MRVAVVGHVEWVTFLPVDRPPRPGAILHASGSWDEPAGGGGVAAAELARLAGACVLHTALGSDPVGQGIPAALASYGVEVRGPSRPESHRRAWTLLDPNGERTIVVAGPAQAAEALQPTAFREVDAVYFCKGDAASLHAARAARVLVATARVLPVVRASGVCLDALVLSANDPGEAYAHGDLDVDPRLVARTDGANGGEWRDATGRTGRWSAVVPEPPVRDAYGCGDRFAAGLAWGLAAGLGVDGALAVAASSGAFALGLRGALGD